MEPLDQYPLDRGPEAPRRRKERRAAIGIAVVVLLLFAAVVAYVVWRRPAATPPESTQAGATTPAEAPTRTPLGPDVQAGELPPLDLSDPLVRDLLGRLSSRPEVAAWLATNGLVRNFVVSVDNVAHGTTPARHLRVLKPAGAFEAEVRGNRILIGQRSYERYTGLTDTVTSLDPAELARSYSTLKPRLQDAYRELGYPDGNFDAAVERAIVRLLQTPVPSGPVTLKEGIVSYRFEDARFEQLTSAQKQLLRMGPQNVSRIQAQLRALARELGIPAERLPAPRGT